MHCQFSQLKKGNPCIKCGRPLALDFPAPYVRHCRAGGPPGPLLGDQVEKMLSAVGITEDRWVEAREKLGGPPKSAGCGCRARKEWLNRAHIWWRKQRKG